MCITAVCFIHNLTATMRSFKSLTILILLLFPTMAYSHAPDELIILEIEQGQLAFQDAEMTEEYKAALKRQRIRRLTAMPWSEKFILFIKAGINHIIPKGLDHILFVLGLFFASLHFRSLFWQMTAFTLAHTLTLALSALRIIQMPSTIIEPLIALSIVWIAVENCLFKKTNTWRPVVIFGFGLLHGLGFAAVLQHYGLPKGNMIPSLLAFNIGVELGQITIIIAAILVFWPFRKNSWYRQRIQIPASLFIAVVGLFWFIERVI